MTHRHDIAASRGNNKRRFRFRFRFGGGLRPVAGLALWVSAFVFLYGGLSVGCRAALSPAPLLNTDSVTLWLSGVWLLHVIGAAALLYASWRRRDDPPRHEGGAAGFLERLTLSLDGIAIAAIVAIGVPILLLPPCS